ncbi:hypothetical protein TSL6_05370 [Sulfurovum sp. TSL6]|uniref:hypothetical protein n=1 Tax=Sulfurovum sp. TSL6 TaxID=2826995 RepID=UPI001CC68A77|nr:hypothetical protein [Sulfurovum sp. TSL6]GIU00031.1 hypothetical protein TSL6_05370 [Sulfurovum sp. TSL6]
MIKKHDTTKLLLNSKKLHAFAIEESLFVYSDETQNVYGFEKGSAALFLQIDELIPHYTVEEIAKKFLDVDTDLVQQMCDLTSGKETAVEVEYESDIEFGTYINDDLIRKHYQVDDIVYAIHYPNDMFYKRLHPVFEYLYVDNPEGKHIVSVDFCKSDDLWEVHWNNTPLGMAMPEKKLATFLQEKMMICTYQSKRYLIALHAGAVEKNGNVIIMPAVSESGKTTLTATLLYHGFHLFSDEVTTLDYNGFVLPLPFCMNIKEGSWKILSEMYPYLIDGDKYSRFDGQNIRFIPPVNMYLGRQKASHIIFPKYIPNSETTLTEIGAKDALEKIKDAGYQVQENMDREKFELILKYLVSLPKYTLVYSNLDEAIDMINTLLEM